MTKHERIMFNYYLKELNRCIEVIKQSDSMFFECESHFEFYQKHGYKANEYTCLSNITLAYRLRKCYLKEFRANDILRVRLEDKFFELQESYMEMLHSYSELRFLNEEERIYMAECELESMRSRLKFEEYKRRVDSGLE